MKYIAKRSLLLVGLLIFVFGCRKDPDLIIFNPDAGTSFLDIENDGYVVTLNASPAPEGQIGTWRIYVGENGRFDELNNPKTKFYGEPGERYVLGWELSKDGQYKAASIEVSFKPLNPVITGIPNDTLKNNISLYLEAEAPKYGAVGEWSIISGNNARLIESQNHEAEFVGSKFEEYVVRWTLSYGSKTAFQEIAFTTDEFKAFAGDDRLDIKTSENEMKFSSLEAFLPAGAEGQWQILNGQNGEVYSLDNPNSLFKGSADTTYSLIWTVQLEDLISSDTVDIRFRGKWGMWKDPADGQTYRYAEINGLEWMSENYNYAADPGFGSVYYGHDIRSIIKDGIALESEEDRKKYGRLYFWQTAVDYAPEGWRLPTYDEFSSLLNILGGPLFAVPKIKVGGETGIDLNFAGYQELSSSSDPAYRNIFTAQDVYGMYWLQDNNDYYAAVVEVSANGDLPGDYPLQKNYYRISVRYVREVQD